jgi:hypothetical protein
MIDIHEMENVMKTKVMALFLILMVASFTSLAQTTPAPKSDDKAMCACCKSDKGEAMKAGEGCCKDCPKDMSCCKHEEKKADATASTAPATTTAADKHEMCKEGAGCCTDKCPMMKKSDGKKSEAMSEKMKGCCSGNKCTMEKMHEHSGN